MNANPNLVVVDDRDESLVSYFPADAWEPRVSDVFQNDTYHWTNQAGAYVTLTFHGSYAAYYSDLSYDHGLFNASVDGAVLFMGSSFATSWKQASILLFDKHLDAGQHTLTVTNVGDGRLTAMGVDYFVYDPSNTVGSTTEEGSSSGPTSPAGSNPPSAAIPSSNPSSTVIQKSHAGAMSKEMIFGIISTSVGLLFFAAALVVFLRARKRATPQPPLHDPPPGYVAVDDTLERSGFIAPFTANAGPTSSAMDQRSAAKIAEMKAV